MGTIAVAAVAVGVLLVPRFFCCPPALPDVDVRIGPIVVASGVGQSPLGDSLSARLTELLTGYPDFSVAGPRYEGFAKTAVSGSAMVDSGGVLRIQLRMPGRQSVLLSTPAAQWRTAADMLADTLLLQLFGSSPLDSELPVRVLPRSPEGLRSFLVAEKAFARASWDSAYDGYREAAAIDRTCALCFWRFAEVARFFVLPPDTVAAAEYRARVREFPADYQTMIRAEQMPLDQRLDSLDALARRKRAFLFGLFRWGDELLHRGPLVGQSRFGATMAFFDATGIRRDFVPAWEHYAWLSIAQGEEWGARKALDTLTRMTPAGRTDMGMRDLLMAAYAWRFLPAAEAQARTQSLLVAAVGRANEPLDAGARYLNHFGAPAGAVWLGEQLEARGYRPPSAMLAQVFGDLSEGRPEQAHRVLARAIARFGSPSLELLDGEIEAALLMFDADSAAATAGWGDADRRLGELHERLPASLRPRAVWMRGLLARRLGKGKPAVSPALPAPLANLLAAYEAASRGRFAEALAKSEPLRLLPAEAVGDPFLRTALYLPRSEWHIRLGKPQLADQELLWYQNSDAIGYPRDEPQPMEVDWAFGTLAQWRRLGLAFESEPRRCTLARDVARFWAGAEPRYADRVDSARAIAARCPEPVP
jgi:hypothetical protein